QELPAPAGDLPVPFFALAATTPPYYYTDPIVTAAGLGFTGWWRRIWMTLRKTWRPLLVVAVLAAGSSVALVLHQTAPSPIGSPESSAGILARVVSLSFVVGFVAGSFGLGASTWLVVRLATGRPAGLASALNHGLRRLLPMVGWTVLYYAGAALVLGL